MTSRRTFLRVLGSAIVGAVVAPEIPFVPKAVRPESFWSSHPQASAGVLTLEILERAYRDCIMGSQAPNLIITHASIARQYGLVYDVDIEVAA